MLEFQSLFERYNKEIFRFLLKLTNNNFSLTEELTQETFYQVYLSMSKYKGKSDIKTWIYAIAKNVCYKYFRKNPTGINIECLEEMKHEQGQIDYSKTPCELIELKDDAAFIRREILNMKKKHRDVLLYRLYFEVSFRDISEAMQISENCAKVIYHRSRKILRARLEDSNNEE